MVLNELKDSHSLSSRCLVTYNDEASTEEPCDMTVKFNYNFTILGKWVIDLISLEQFQEY